MTQEGLLNKSDVISHLLYGSARSLPEVDNPAYIIYPLERDEIDRVSQRTAIHSDKVPVSPPRTSKLFN